MVKKVSRWFASVKHGHGACRLPDMSAISDVATALGLSNARALRQQRARHLQVRHD
jgi:hypothetical protein